MNKSLLILIPILLAIAGYHQLNYASVNAPQVPLHVANLHSSWMGTYNKVYKTPEERHYRMSIFHKNYEMVTRHNANPDATYTMELNQFADMDRQERRAKLLMGNLSEKDIRYIESKPRATAEDAPEPISEVKEGMLGGNPQEVDWRTYGYVPNQVLHQGQCGSCWAHSAAAMAEASYNVRNKK